MALKPVGEQLLDEYRQIVQGREAHMTADWGYGKRRAHFAYMLLSAQEGGKKHTLGEEVWYRQPDMV